MIEFKFGEAVRVVSVYMTASESSEGTEYIWSDGTISPTRPITEDDIGKPFPSVRAVTIPGLVCELGEANAALAEMTGRADDAERALVDVTADRDAALERRDEEAHRRRSEVAHLDAMVRARIIERDDAWRRIRELREALRAVLGEDK